MGSCHGAAQTTCKEILTYVKYILGVFALLANASSCLAGTRAFSRTPQSPAGGASHFWWGEDCSASLAGRTEARQQRVEILLARAADLRGETTVLFRCYTTRHHLQIFSFSNFPDTPLLLFLRGKCLSDH